MIEEIKFTEPVTVEERAKWEATQDLSKFTKIRNSAADTFTPYQIKFLSKGGRKYMGVYGVLALSLLLFLTLANAYGLIKSGEDRPLVLVNLLLPFVIALLMLEKMISGLLNSFIKKFQ